MSAVDLVSPDHPDGERTGRPRVVIAHDYITQRGGAERVVLSMARAFPGAEIHTLFHDAESTYPQFASLVVRASMANRFAWLRRRHRMLLPLLPWLVRSHPVGPADVVVASSSGWAHGFASTGATVVYCHTPARWLYQGDRYLGRRTGLGPRVAMRVLRPWLRAWDRRAAARATVYLANSTVVAERIAQEYGRTARVLPPAVPPSTIGRVPDRQQQVDIEPGYYLCVSRHLAYKNIDVVIEAINRSPGRRLVVVGSGPLTAQLEELASERVTFLKDLTESELREVYEGARSLVSASYEDFGLTPIEAAAHGKPSVLLRWGGFLDSTIEGRTGTFFDAPTVEEVLGALDRADAQDWDAQAIKDHAAGFSEERFVEELRAEVARVWADVSQRRP